MRSGHLNVPPYDGGICIMGWWDYLLVALELPITGNCANRGCSRCRFNNPEYVEDLRR